MADRMAGFAHVRGVGAWVSASPRVQRVVGAGVGVMLVAGLATVAANHPVPLRQSLSVAAAVGPVDDMVSPRQTADAHTTLAAASRSAGSAPKRAVRTTGWAYLAARIRGCESGSGPGSTPDYEAENPETSASGAYQIVDSTWAGRYGVDHASDATPEQQEATAYDLYRRRGTADWAASASCWR